MPAKPLLPVSTGKSAAAIGVKPAHIDQCDASAVDRKIDLQRTSNVTGKLFPGTAK